ncbi:hypothetical protein BsIDN1_07790 [Bacillus safensis]|uniref:Uncharacterized protein n=1 Tax=Bacillus safensis TaxID=561879 RepID=A0A5S9M2E6_BACIA|nr:hypothetical protein BsIDN1_07790 [Bacillus safensis]
MQHMQMSTGCFFLTAGINGNIIRFLTPLVITDELLHEGLGIIEDAFKSTLNNKGDGCMQKKQQMAKTMSQSDVLFLSIGAMLGWGWVVLSGDWI